MREVGLVKYCLALADWVTEGRCNDCWGEGAGDCSWHRKCKEDNLRERQPLPRLVRRKDVEKGF